jgi:hypothetical protein
MQRCGKARQPPFSTGTYLEERRKGESCCTQIPTVGVAIDAVSFINGGGWASSYPTATDDPAYPNDVATFR